MNRSVEVNRMPFKQMFFQPIKLIVRQRSNRLKYRPFKGIVCRSLKGEEDEEFSAAITSTTITQG
jgi:hypothetical protein